MIDSERKASEAPSKNVLFGKVAKADTLKTVLGRSVEAVAVLSGIGGNFFRSIAPPEETSVAFAVGVSTTAATILYILVLVAARGRSKAKHRKFWFGVAVMSFGGFLLFAYKYNNDRDRLTFLWPPNEPNQELKVAGEQLTPDAHIAKQRDSSLTNAQLVSGFGGIEGRTRVWTEQSIRQANTKLKVDYVLLFLSVATAVFCATEGILLRNAKRQKS